MSLQRSRSIRFSEGGGPLNVRAASVCDGTWRKRTLRSSGTGAVRREYAFSITNETRVRVHPSAAPKEEVRTGAVIDIFVPSLLPEDEDEVRTGAVIAIFSFGLFRPKM